jgi:hypothetical protein
MFDHLTPSVTRPEAIQTVATVSGLSLPESSAKLTALAKDLGYSAPFTPRQVEAMADLIRDEAPAEFAYKVVGENTLTGNTWDCETGLSAELARETRAGYARLESDYKIEYRIIQYRDKR